MGYKDRVRPRYYKGGYRAWYIEGGYLYLASGIKLVVCFIILI
jgi:hypothetical protein